MYVYGYFSFCFLVCKSNILFNRTNIFRDKTSFRQFLTWLLPGLKTRKKPCYEDQEEAMLETGESLSYL